MSENLQTGYQSFSDRDGERPTVQWRKFYVHLSGRTNDAHLPWVSRFEGIGQVQVTSPEDSDYILLFCPIASRVGTDISEALENIPGVNKPVILVVMHHTFNREHVVAESRRQVNNPKVLLVVDTLFFEGRLLQSNVNDMAWHEIKKCLGVHGRAPAEVLSRGLIEEWLRNNRRNIIIYVFGVLALILVIVLIYELSTI